MLTIVVTFVPAWHRYFARTDDLVSVLVVPIVPSLVYAALLLVMAVALRRRLRTAWWVMVVWWLVLPEADRLVEIADGDQWRHKGCGPAACRVGRYLRYEQAAVDAWLQEHLEVRDGAH